MVSKVVLLNKHSLAGEVVGNGQLDESCYYVVAVDGGPGQGRGGGDFVAAMRPEAPHDR